MIYVFGDSIAAGQHCPVHESWPVLLSNYHPTQVAARNGDTTRDALQRMPFDIQAHRPKTLVVQFGLNDGNQWDTDEGLPRVSLPAFRENLREIVVRGRTFGAKVYLVTNHPTRKGPRFEKSRTHYNQAIRDVAREHGAGLVDPEFYWEDDRYLLDGIHLNPEGHRYYCERVAQALGLVQQTAAHHPV